jgi:hypothetical protein
MCFWVFSVARAANVQQSLNSPRWEAELPRVVPRPRRDAENEEISPEVFKQLGLALGCPLCFGTVEIPGNPRDPLSVTPVSRQLIQQLKCESKGLRPLC